jgi:hypothetical protein
MEITFNLYGANGLVSTNTLTADNFAKFCKIAESLKQTVRIKSVK